ncbi:MAG: TOBE domain-containing protein [Calditrichaeota bacterium]|nr:TOBE domain-containing protein [Calditrichota bacterium]MCB0305155.1 TOBE domain-containing protein [Calditrichota bacterium]MCB9086982.1 TOBE domain-containing protein [Calditrichia bacterium]
MNRLKAEITAIESGGHISLVELRAHGDRFSCVVIETPQTAAYLRIGREVEILFKETEVSIAKDLSGEISLRNRIPAMIKQVDKGAVLARIVLDYRGLEIVSIITTRSANRLNLRPGDRVIGLVKANEVSILA